MNKKNITKTFIKVIKRYNSIRIVTFTKSNLYVYYTDDFTVAFCYLGYKNKELTKSFPSKLRKKIKWVMVVNSRFYNIWKNSKEVLKNEN